MPKEPQQELAELKQALRECRQDRKDKVAANRELRQSLQNVRNKLALARDELSELKAVLGRQHQAISQLKDQNPPAPRAQSTPSDDKSSECPPIVVIASGGSSGSHVLARLLAEYEPYVIGPEANLASRPDLFEPASYRAALLKGIMHKSPIIEPQQLGNGRIFHVVPPMLLTNGAAYGVESFESRARLLATTDNWHQLIATIRDNLVDSGLIRPGSCLIEHSPSVAVSMPQIAEAYPRLRLIHLVRDPRDAVASLMRRRQESWFFKGLADQENLEISAKQWCFLTACALKTENSPAYLRVRYEDLVTEPEATVAHILDHLGQTAPRQWHGHRGMLTTIERQPGWKNSPLGKISTSSIGRHRASLADETLSTLRDLSFSFPEFDIEVDMATLIERFAYQGVVDGSS